MPTDIVSFFLSQEIAYMKVKKRRDSLDVSWKIVLAFYSTLSQSSHHRINGVNYSIRKQYIIKSVSVIYCLVSILLNLKYICGVFCCFWWITVHFLSIMLSCDKILVRVKWHLLLLAVGHTLIHTLWILSNIYSLRS